MTTLPKYDDFMLPTLKALDALGGSASMEEIQDRLVWDLALTPEQMEAAYRRAARWSRRTECRGRAVT